MVPDGLEGGAHTPRNGEEPSKASQTTRKICWFDRLPAWLFYAPIALFWLAFSIRYRSFTLPTSANPSFESGGLVGESKLQLMAQVAPHALTWFAPQTSMMRSTESHSVGTDLLRARLALAAAGLHFPVVAKPDRGHHGFGVHPVDSDAELASYSEHFPPGKTIILQQLVPFAPEAGVFYVRLPGEQFSQLFSLDLSESPHVVGNGILTLRDLIAASSMAPRCRELHLDAQRERLAWIPPSLEVVTLAFARSHRLGAVLRDGRSFATPALLEKFEEIAGGIEEFYFGRFDVRFRQLDEFQRGESFQIVEINGAGAEVNHIWDPDSRLLDAYKTLFAQYRPAFQIGHLNRSRGFKPIGLKRLWTFFITQQRILASLQSLRARSPY